jgi:hypothetical protein
VVSAWRHDAVLCHCLHLRCHRGRRSSMSRPVHPVGPPMNFGQRHRWATDDASGPTQRLGATAPRCRRCPLPQMSTTTASPIIHRVVATARRHAALPRQDGGTALGAGRVDDVDGDDNGCCGGSQLGDDGIGVDANVVVVIVDKEWGRKGRRHAG